MTAFSAKRRLGDDGERVAQRFLQSKGYEIIECNYLKPWGEIDIVARKEDVYHFVEVKTISREKGSEPPAMTAEDHIHPAKMKKLVRTVELYMVHVKGSPDYQIDVVAVELDFATRKARCTLYEQVL
jgi:putative endonuclease